DSKAKPLKEVSARTLERLKINPTGELPVIFEIRSVAITGVPHPIEDPDAIPQFPMADITPELKTDVAYRHQIGDERTFAESSRGVGFQRLQTDRRLEFPGAQLEPGLVTVIQVGIEYLNRGAAKVRDKGEIPVTVECA